MAVKWYLRYLCYTLYQRIDRQSQLHMSSKALEISLFVTLNMEHCTGCFFIKFRIGQN